MPRTLIRRRHRNIQCSDNPRSPLCPLWLLILIVGTIVGLSMGRAQSMGLYLPPVTKALDIGREPFGLAMALAQLMMGLGAPLSGGLIDKFGAGRIVVVCVLRDHRRALPHVRGHSPTTC
mgnify:CR=1 FL=1